MNVILLCEKGLDSEFDSIMSRVARGFKMTNDTLKNQLLIYRNR